jgi:hypothetical protein
VTDSPVAAAHEPLPWRQRVGLFVQRFWQPTSACMTCMPGGMPKLWSVEHWGHALQTGLFTGAIALLLTFTPAARLYRNRYGNAAVVGALTVAGDAFSHAGHGATRYGEAVLTGIVSTALALAGSFAIDAVAPRWRAWRAARTSRTPGANAHMP